MDERGLMNRLFSYAYWCFLGTTSIVLYLVALLLWLLTAPFDPTRRVLHHYTCWWAQLYLRCLPGCRIQIEGREKIKPGTAYVFVSNHQSLTDIMALSALAVPFKWVSKKEVFRIPWIGWNMYLNRYVCVDRGSIRNVRTTMETCRRWLEQGVPLFIFPEGHRSPDGEMIPFHSGAFKLALEANCPVVPIVVNGTKPIYQGSRVLLTPGTIHIHVLDPVTADEAGTKADKFRDEVFRRMQCALHALRVPAAECASA
jgi:1-acyl-sn-glycerol-3-phosphate acyltransferase